MCPPDHFHIASVDNPHMEGQIVDAKRARQQWDALVDAYGSIGVQVIVAAPSPNHPDMVFTANPILSGPPGSGTVMPARMRYAGRRGETRLLMEALPDAQMVPASTDEVFEGGGDFLWTPDGRLIAASGPRTDADAIPAVAAGFGVEPIVVRLVDERFYHLDTCLCILDDSTAMWVPSAFDEDSHDVLHAAFERLLDVSDDAMDFAANAHCPDGRHVLIDRACQKTMASLEQAGYTPIPVDTSEFRKSGGSVYCMKHVVS